MDFTLSKSQKEGFSASQPAGQSHDKRFAPESPMIDGNQVLEILSDVPGATFAYLEREAVVSAKAMMRQVREKQGFSQNEVAKTLGLDRKSVTAAENAFSRDTITLKTLVRMLAACGYRLEFRAIPIDSETNSCAQKK
jgi:DNA-binding XRE family transcriptional regulator